jgi:hypothetical protein
MPGDFFFANMAGFFRCVGSLKSGWFGRTSVGSVGLVVLASEKGEVGAQAAQLGRRAFRLLLEPGARGGVVIKRELRMCELVTQFLLGDRGAQIASTCRLCSRELFSAKPAAASAEIAHAAAMPPSRSVGVRRGVRE